MDSILKNKKTNKLVHSVVALTLLVVLLLTASYAWLTNQLTANVSADYITVDPDAGLEMNYGNEDMNQSSIDINDAVKEGFAFRECSSTDGKRIFFPLSEYSPDGDNDFASSTGTATKDPKFREATAGDKNTKYISIDLSLYAKNDTPVWLSSDTKIQGSIANAIRIAFIENVPGGKTVVFDNSSQGYGDSYDGIAALKTNNSVDSTNRVTCSSIQAYTSDHEDNPLFELKGGVEKNITVNIWLEGTDNQCTGSLATLKDLDIYIQFSTSTEDKVPYYFIDHTLEQWVDDDNCYVFAFDAEGNEHPMKKSGNYDTDHTWIVEMNASKKPVQFARYNPDDPDGEWNIWESEDPGSCSTYNAFAHNTGMWDDNFTGETITFYDAMSDHVIIEQSGETEMLVSFTTEDGNGNPIDLVYKMSNQWDHKRWRIVIPSDVSDITFLWCANDDLTGEAPWLYWENTERGTNTHFSATDYGYGYWSDRILLVDGESYIEDGVIYVAYFFKGNTEIAWTAMNAKTAEGRYIAAVPEGATGVIFCRYADDYAGGFYWDSVYNQTYDLAIGTNNMYMITGYAGDRFHLNGSWKNTSNID